MATDGQRSPSLTEPSGGRDPATGKFLAGNAFAQGNPHAKRVGELRTAMLEAVTPRDLRAIVKKLIAQAKAGDVIAAREVLDRSLGKASQTIYAELRQGFILEMTDEQKRRAQRIADVVDAVDLDSCAPPAVDSNGQTSATTAR